MGLIGIFYSGDISQGGVKDGILFDSYSIGGLCYVFVFVAEVTG